MIKELVVKIKESRGILKKDIKDLDGILVDFPKLEEFITTMKKEISNAKCTSCKRNKLSTRLLNKIVKELPEKIEDISKYPSITKTMTEDAKLLFMNNSKVDLDKLSFKDAMGIPPSREIMDIKTDEQRELDKKITARMYKDSVDNLLDIDYLERPSCIACCCKHIAQASILMKEMSQGYPEHIKYAIEHINKASNDVPKHQTEMLNKIKKALLNIHDLEQPNNISLKHIKIANRLMNETIKELSPLFNINRWKIIGHLSEAADESAEDYPDFSNFLRNERLSMMEDDKYNPPFNKMISKFTQKLKEVEDQDKQAPSIS